MKAATQQHSVSSLLKNFKQTECGKSLLTMESSFSLPIPFFVKERKFISALVYRSQKTEAGPFNLFPPHAMFSLDVASAAMVQFVDYTVRPPFGKQTPASDQSIGSFPHPQVKELKPGEYRDRRQQVEGLIDQLSANDNLGGELMKLFALLMEPAFAPYYWTISPPGLRSFMAPGSAQSGDQ